MSDDVRGAGFAIAYRMLGSVSEAEDVVQEGMLRLHRAGDSVESPRAYLATVVTRLAIDELRSARARRERYVGAWLPEPLLTDERDPGSEVELSDSLSQAFLVVLESLSPVERAVFLLREVFDYEYAEIAQVVERSEDNCRQLARRARQHVEAGRPRFEPSRDERERLAERFFAACRQGEVEELERLLAADVVAYGDGGGKAPALARPVEGPARVARLMLALFTQAPTMGVTVSRAEVNGDPGLVARDADGRLVSVMSIEIGEGRIRGVRSVVNPDKLAHLGEVGDLRSLVRRRSH